MIRQFVSNYVTELKESVDLIPLDKLESAIKVLFDAHESGHQIFVMGNG